MKLLSTEVVETQSVRFKEAGYKCIKFETYFKLLLCGSLILDRHLILVLLKVLSLGGLQVKPGITKIANVGQQRLDERMVFVLNIGE